MTTELTSLARLHDIVAPPPAPWWPPAPGWLALLGLAALLSLYLLVRLFIRHQRNRYRREALAELARLEAAATSARADALLDLSVLLKRVAVTAYPRVQVARLSGVDWFAFLDDTGGTRFADGRGALLAQAVYGGTGSGIDAAQFTALASEARRWIRQHRPQSARDAALPGGPGPS